MDKKIIAALEIADREVRLLVGQFFNGRLNVLKVEKVEHDGFSGGRITRPQKVIEAIKKAIDNASTNLNAKITKVLLSVHGHDVIIERKRTVVPVVGRISEFDIRHAYQDLRSQNTPEGMVCVNVLLNRYYVNGIATRKVPLNEQGDRVEIDAQCFYCSTADIYSLVQCVEDAGVGIIEIVLSDIGLAKEASLFEASVDHPIVGVSCELQSTHLTLYHQGQILSAMDLNYGFDVFISKIMETYKLSRDVVERLLYYNVDVNNVSPSDDPIFVWSTKSNSHELSEKDLLNCVGSDIIRMIDDIHDTCEPIYDLGKVSYVFTGVASRITGLADTMKTMSGAESTVYRSSTFGVKDPRYSSLMGTFYFYKDTEFFRGSSLESVDQQEFISHAIGDIQSKKSNENSNSVTKRLKTLFTDL